MMPLFMLLLLLLLPMAATAQSVISGPPGPTACDLELSRERAYSGWVGDFRNRAEFNIQVLSERYQALVRERDALKKGTKDAPATD